MIKYVIASVIIIYCLIVAVKLIKDIKAGKCPGCSGGDCCSCKSNPKVK